MLVELFPRDHSRYALLPILGRHLEGFLVWLRKAGHSNLALRRRVRAARQFDELLCRKKVRDLGPLTSSDLLGNIPTRPGKDAALAAGIRSIVAYFEQQGTLASTPMTASQRLVADYEEWLQRNRGLAIRTVRHHTGTIREFLNGVGFDRDSDRLHTLCQDDVERFIQRLSLRRGRASLQHVTAHLRAFLRWLTSRGWSCNGLAAQVDTPRVYRDERLPRSLAWETVVGFLSAIDRTTTTGRRDYAIFLLIATYGLRASEVVALTLDDIQWSERTICVPRSKVGRRLLLPLTDEVGASVIDYLQHGRPASACREVFLRVKLPLDVLQPTAITEAFQGWARRSGLPIPFHGPHCLRHSLAVHLLRQGTSLKSIGDLLGHRSTESTCVYLRLGVDDLRDVALDVPNEVEQTNGTN